MKEIIKNLCLISLGTLLFAIAISSIVIPNELGEGGVTGLTLILLYVFQISPALSNLIINIFLMIIGWRFLEKATIYYTLVAIGLLSLFLQFVHLPVFLPTNAILAPITSGFLIGIGLGVVILGRGTTAGADIIAFILNKFYGLPIPTAFLLIDICIILPLALIIGVEQVVLTAVSLFITNRMLNFVIDGLNPKKAVMIVSKHNDAIAQRIMHEVGRGITVLRGYGYYSREEREVLFVVINRIQLMKTQRIINEIDSTAFVTITEIQQVIGEGFTFHLEKNHEMDEDKRI